MEASLQIIEQRSMPEPNSGCWLWLGATYRMGYGFFRSGGRRIAAHRFSWAVHHGRPVPPGMVVMHKCDVPSCVNPEHLNIGTQRDNLRDARGKGRLARNPDPSGHTVLSAADVIAIRNDPRGSRRIAPQYGVCDRHIRHIRAGQKRSIVTEAR